MTYPQPSFGTPPGGGGSGQADRAGSQAPELSQAQGPASGDESTGKPQPMPLDSRSESEVYHAAGGWRPDSLSLLEQSATLGEALRAAREAQGRSIEALSADTRVPARYLKALEADDHTALPPAAYAVGHARAYARALGLDEGMAADRFRAEQPGAVRAELQPPVGVAFDDQPRRSPLLVAVIATLVVAVVGWNVFQRLNAMDRPQPSDVVETPRTWRVGSTLGVLRLEAPRQAPPDQSTPAFYMTPGLEDELAPVLADSIALAPPARDVGVGAAFNPRGAVYGAAAGRSDVILQARRPVGIVVRSADGTVHFARQLAAGEAWRAPRSTGLTVDVSDPAAFAVYVNGEFDRYLDASLTRLDGLNAEAQRRLRAAAEEEAEAARALAALQEAAERRPAAPSGPGPAALTDAAPAPAPVPATPEPVTPAPTEALPAT